MTRVCSNRDAIMVFGAALLLMGLDCLRMSLMGGVPMPPETHGSAMYEIPAELWGLIVIAQGAALLWGAYGNHAMTVMVAGIIGGLLYYALFAMADQASLGFIVSRGAFVFGMLNTAAASAATLDLFAWWLERQIEAAMAGLDDRGRD